MLLGGRIVRLVCLVLFASQDFPGQIGWGLGAGLRQATRGFSFSWGLGHTGQVHRVLVKAYLSVQGWPRFLGWYIWVWRYGHGLWFGAHSLTQRATINMK